MEARKRRDKVREEIIAVGEEQVRQLDERLSKFMELEERLAGLAVLGLGVEEEGHEDALNDSLEEADEKDIADDG